MQMVRHNDKFVQQISSLLSVSHHVLDENSCVFWNLEDRVAIPCLRRDEVGQAWSRSMRQASHPTSKAKALPLQH